MNKVTKKAVFKKIAFSFCFAFSLSILAYYFESIGYNDIGMCSTKQDARFNGIIFVAMLISFIFSIYFLVKPI